MRASIRAIVAALSLAFSGMQAAETISQHHLRARTQKNVLRAHLGAVGGTGSACPLLADDPTQPLALREGEYSIEIDLSDLHVVSELAFVNEATRGSFKCLISTNRQDWHSAITVYLMPDSRASSVHFVPMEARYVRLQLSITEPGNLYSLGLFGLTLAADYHLHEKEDESYLANKEIVSQDWNSESTHQVSLTITPSDATVPWMSSTRSALTTKRESLELIDENSFTVCEFATEDPTPTVILDLEKVRSIDRIGVLYAKQPGTFILRLFATSPPHPSPDALPSSAQEFEEHVFEDNQGRGKIAFKNLASRSRFIALIWKPKSVPAGAQQSSPAFSINEVAVFSTENRRFVEPSQTRALIARPQIQPKIDEIAPFQPPTIHEVTPLPSDPGEANTPSPVSPVETFQLGLDPVSF